MPRQWLMEGAGALGGFGDTLGGFGDTLGVSEVCGMRPCDCKTMRDLMDLKERSVKLNDQSVTLGPPGVLLKVGSNVRINLTQDSFKRFAEWYLTDQLWE